MADSVTPSLPAIRSGFNRPLRISVRSALTVQPPFGKKISTALLSG